MQYLKLYSNCILVKGYNRSLICDIQKGKYFYIPNELYEILVYNEKYELTYNELLSNYTDEKDGLKLYTDWLKKEDLIFFTTIPKNFPKLNLEFDLPAFISNSIIDFDAASNYLAELHKIVELGCKNFQIRFFLPINYSKIINIITKIQTNNDIENIEVILPYFKEYSTEYFSINFPKISKIIVYNSPYEDYETLTDKVVFATYTKDLLTENNCGKISKNTFSCNQMFFSEAQKHNTCLNRKLSINKNGAIVNCPSMPITYGQIKDVNVNEILLNKRFTKYWKIKKDDIKICKDCEYRYICSDCRVFTQNSGDLYSKPAKCLYDPYTNTWANSEL